MEKVFITDKQGNKVLPKTHVSAVYDDEGNDLGSHLGAFEDEVRGLVDTPHQEYVTVATYASLPASGSKDTIYRVSNYDGSQSQVAVDVYSEYAWDGTQYVFLCVKSAVGEVFDISAYHNNTKYADLNAALTSNTGGVPQALQKGGMSVKFVQSSDNKYVQYRLMTITWSNVVTDWSFCGDDVLVDNPEYIEVKTDKDGKILWAIKTDGNIYYGAGVPQQVIDYIEKKIADLSLDEYDDIVAFLSDYLGSDTTLKTLLDSKLDAEGLDANALGTIEAVENPEYIAAETDAEDKVLGGRKTNGIKFENVGFETPKLDINGNIVENIQDLEGRTEIKTDAEGKILSYRDSEGVIHENAGIKLSKKGYNDFYVEQKEYVDKSILYFNPKEIILPILENFKMWYNVGSTTPNYNNLTLLWFSDIHRDSINLSRIREFYNEYQDYIDDVLSTGDNCKAEPSEDYSWWADNGGSSFLTVLGNHDALAEENVPKSPKFLYEMFFEPFLSESNIIITENKTYWYKDYSFASSENNPGGIRLISLDCYHWKEPEGTTYDDGSVTDSGEQETWFVNLLNDAKENGMAVIVSLHSPTNEHTALPCTFQVIEDLQIGRTTGYLTDDMLDDVQSFIDAGGVFVTWLTGHAHFDLFCTSERHSNQLILCISTASHTVQWRNVANVKDTKSQDCFNLVSIEPYSGFIRLFRIGTKYDRHGRHIGSALYDYINHRLINSD